VRSSIALDTYEDSLASLLHVAGTKYFGAVYKDTELAFPISVTSTITPNVGGQSGFQTPENSAYIILF
jgi:hypothetical protein